MPLSMHPIGLDLAGGANAVYFVGVSGQVGYTSGTFGVRPVVSLKSKVKFTSADKNRNNIQTWDITI